MQTFEINQQEFFEKMLDMRDDINVIKGTIQGSVTTQAAMAADIESIKLRVSTNETDIRALKTLSTYAIAVWTVATFAVGAITAPGFSAAAKSITTKLFG